MLLSQDRNVGVHYRYSIPESSAHLTGPETYSWAFAPFGECSSKCGGGVQQRNITCNSEATMQQVDHSLCDASIRPSDTQPCAQASCPANWIEGEWSRCSAPCGGNGTQTREIKCQEILSNG